MFSKQYNFFLQDTTPPNFTGCPLNPVTLTLATPLATPTNLSLPVVMDNSGRDPVIHFLPQDFALPYMFVRVSLLSV